MEDTAWVIVALRASPGLSMSSFTPLTVTVCGRFHAAGAKVSVCEVPAAWPPAATLAAVGVPEVTVTVTAAVGLEPSTTV